MIAVFAKPNYARPPYMEDDLNFSKMEDNLNFCKNGRCPQFFGKWKMTSIFLKIEDDLIFFENGR